MFFLVVTVSIAYADESVEDENTQRVTIKLAPPKIAKPAPPKYNVLKPLPADGADATAPIEERIKVGKLKYLSVSEIAALEAEEALPAKVITTVTKPNPEHKYKSLGIFKVTHYCPCTSCSGEYGTNTASGETCRPGIIAADLSVLPMHSVVYLGDSKTEYVVKDVGGGVKGNHIDIFVENHEEVNGAGMYYAELFALE